MSLARAFTALLCMFVMAKVVAAEPLATGLRPGAAERIDQYFNAAISGGRVPGAVVMVSRNGHLAYQGVFGVSDPRTGVPMSFDSIFRIASMTKPVTAVAALILADEGKLKLQDPISKYLPYMRRPTLLADAGADAELKRVRADREITIHDLLTHTSGITYGAGDSAAERLMRQTRINAAAQFGMTDQQVAEELARLPLMFQPGTAWFYGRSTDILLALVEAVGGEPADRFYRERIFEPLKMHDTFFRVPPEKVSRLARSVKDPATADIARPSLYLGGGDGLWSTAPDYMRFATMLFNLGELDGVRILKVATAKSMTTDQIGPGLARGKNYFPGIGVGFGYTVAVRTAPGAADRPGSVGAFWWTGYRGTTFRVDHRSNLVTVTMMDASGPPQSAINGDLYRIIYKNLD